MNLLLERRLGEHRARLLVRSWEYRQRRHARGAWFRLRRVLTEAAAAYVVSADDARQLIAEGHRAEQVGTEFEPPKVLLFVGPERVKNLACARPVPVRLGGELLLADHLVLVPFISAGSSPAPSVGNERD